MERIEFYEKYLTTDYDEIELFENLGIPVKKSYSYRRINPLLDDIDTPVEMPENPNECIIRFYHGGEIIVKGSYDEICILLNDRENNAYSEDED